MAISPDSRPGAHPGEPDDANGRGEALPLSCSWFYLLGLQSYGLGLARADNPYLVGAAAHAEWDAGWLAENRAERWERWSQEAREAAYFNRL